MNYLIIDGQEPEELNAAQVELLDYCKTFAGFLF
jgi:hypothetical protein